MTDEKSTNESILNNFLEVDPIYSTEIYDDEFPDINDEIFIEWYVLKEGVSLREAVEALIQYGGHIAPGSRGYSIRIPDRDALPEDDNERKEFLKYCTEHEISVILKREVSNEYYDLNVEGIYFIKEDAVYAAWNKLTRGRVPLFPAAFDESGRIIKAERNMEQLTGKKEIMEKTIIVYYSLEGNTDHAAKKIGEKLEADLLRIDSKKAYPDSGFRKFLVGGFSAVVGKTPALKPYTFDGAGYDRIILGFPVWAGNVTPPIRTFIKENDLKGKKIAAFACQGGSGAEKALEKLRACLGVEKLEAELILIEPKNKPCEENDQKIEAFCAGLRSRDPEK